MSEYDDFDGISDTEHIQEKKKNKQKRPIYRAYGSKILALERRLDALRKRYKKINKEYTLSEYVKKSQLLQIKQEGESVKLKIEYYKKDAKKVDSWLDREVDVSDEIDMRKNVSLKNIDQSLRSERMEDFFDKYPFNKGKSRKDDQEKLMSLFKKWVSVEELAKIFWRTKLAIWRRLTKTLNWDEENHDVCYYYNDEELKIEEMPIKNLIASEDVGVGKIAQYINIKYKENIKGQDINDWLKSQWILSEYKDEEGKKRTIINDRSSKYGIISKKKVGRMWEEYDAIIFEEKGKKFILDNREEIIRFMWKWLV